MYFIIVANEKLQNAAGFEKDFVIYFPIQKNKLIPLVHNPG